MKREKRREKRDERREKREEKREKREEKTETREERTSDKNEAARGVISEGSGLAPSDRPTTRIAAYTLSILRGGAESLHIYSVS